MNRFIKKLLARYVTYIEIIGYAFVVLFVAGMIALSYIKAEDELVNVQGKFEVPADLIQFDRSHYVIDQLSDSNAVVEANAPLFELTDDEQFIAEQTILNNLQGQMEIARAAAQKDLQQELNRITSSLIQKRYPYLRLSTLRAKMAGDFLITNLAGDLIPKNKIIGGVFDFENNLIRVTEFPPDRQVRRKLKLGQTGTATLKLSPTESINLSVVLVSMNEKEAYFHSPEIAAETKFKIATYLCSNSESNQIEASISVLVGWKSWMRLIWR
jgi:hypothetical protein